jgi:hypothetical protein
MDAFDLLWNTHLRKVGGFIGSVTSGGELELRRFTEEQIIGVFREHRKRPSCAGDTGSRARRSANERPIMAARRCPMPDV